MNNINFNHLVDSQFVLPGNFDNSNNDAVTSEVIGEICD